MVVVKTLTTVYSHDGEVGGGTGPLNISKQSATTTFEGWPLTTVIHPARKQTHSYDCILCMCVYTSTKQKWTEFQKKPRYRHTHTHTLSYQERGYHVRLFERYRVVDEGAAEKDGHYLCIRTRAHIHVHTFYAHTHTYMHTDKRKERFTWKSIGISAKFQADCSRLIGQPTPGCE